MRLIKRLRTSIISVAESAYNGKWNLFFPLSFSVGVCTGKGLNSSMVSLMSERTVDDGNTKKAKIGLFLFGWLVFDLARQISEPFFSLFFFFWGGGGGGAGEI